MAFAQGDDRVTHALPGRGGPRPLARREKERPLGILAKLMTEYAEAAGGIAEARRDRVGRKPLKEIRAERLVLAVNGVRQFEERPRERR